MLLPCGNHPGRASHQRCMAYPLDRLRCGVSCVTTPDRRRSPCSSGRNLWVQLNGVGRLAASSSTCIEITASYPTEYTHPMRLRAALATLTAVLLLTISCAASACSASCDAMAVGGGCSHSQSAASGERAGHPMSGMSHREMTGPDDMADLAMVMLSSSSCTHHVCELAPTLLRSDDGDAQLLVAIQPASLSTQSISVPEMESQIEAVGTPPLRSRLVAALQTTLRI